MLSSNFSIFKDKSLHSDILISIPFWFSWIADEYMLSSSFTFLYKKSRSIFRLKIWFVKTWNWFGLNSKSFTERAKLGIYFCFWLSAFAFKYLFISSIFANDILLKYKLRVVNVRLLLSTSIIKLHISFCSWLSYKLILVKVLLTSKLLMKFIMPLFVKKLAEQSKCVITLFL